MALVAEVVQCIHHKNTIEKIIAKRLDVEVLKRFFENRLKNDER